MFAQSLEVMAEAVSAGRSLLRKVCLAAGIALAARGAVVTLQAPETSDGFIAVPIHIAPENGDQMASLQFDLDFDASRVQITDIEAGACASQAAKDVVFSSMTDGTVRVIVAGMNQNTLTEGVVAMVYMQRVDNGLEMPVMGLDSIVVADPVGNSVEAGYENLMAGESADVETDSSSSTSNEATEALRSKQTEKNAAKAVGASVQPGRESLTSGNGPLDPFENESVAKGPAPDAATEVVQDNRSSRSRQNATIAGAEGIAHGAATDGEPGPATRSSGTMRHQFLPGAVSKRSLSESEAVTLSGKAAEASGETTLHTARVSERMAAALTSRGTVVLDSVRNGTAVPPAGTPSGRFASGFQILALFLAPLVMVVVFVAARHVYAGKVRKPGIPKMR